MTLDKLRQYLEAHDWRFAAPFQNTGVNWYAWERQSGLPNCDLNDKPPSLVLVPWVIDTPDGAHYSIEFDICGELHGLALKLQAYSVSPDEFTTKLPVVRASLRNAWTAVAALQGDK